MKIDLNKITVSSDRSHHLLAGKPLYTTRFLQVLNFHSPGMAAVLDDTGAYHIDLNGNAIYTMRYTRCFGFYNGRATVVKDSSWFHILPTGQKLYSQSYSWCGNYQNDACVVKDIQGYYFHIDLDGNPLYNSKYTYAGDFRDGIAVIQKQDGLHTHIYRDGCYVHNKWFEDLDVFHKGFARAKDKRGWCHIDVNGQPIYPERYKMIDSFYNGYACVENQYGARLIIDEHGVTHTILKEPSFTPLQQLSADLVGYWKTQTVKAAVELKVFEYLPCDKTKLAIEIHLNLAVLERLLRALYELDLIYKQGDILFPTEKGKLLQSDNKMSLAAASLHWASEPYFTWASLTEALKTNSEMYTKKNGLPIFAWLEKNNSSLLTYHTALRAYARHDYWNLADKIDLSNHKIIIDAGGGDGTLLTYLMAKNQHLKGILLESESVIKNIINTSKGKVPFTFASFDIFKKWPKAGDAIFLSRILHDWDEQSCITILKRAGEALLPHGNIYLVEMLLNEKTGDGGMLDLNMLVLTGGKERTKDQFDDLVKYAGFKIEDIALLNSNNYIIKLIPN